MSLLNDAAELNIDSISDANANAASGHKASLRSVRVLAIHELVIEEIRRAIEMWIFHPGDFLPTERKMAEVLGVSRSTVRTATALLESEGLLSVKRGRGGGYVVQDPALAENRGDVFIQNPAVALDAWDFRMVADVGAARMAAERRTDDDIEIMDEILDEMDIAFAKYADEETLEHARHCQALDSRFFLALAEATRSHYVVDAVLEARRALWVAFSSYLTRLDPSSQSRRRGILDAIRRQEPEIAEAQMRRYLLAGRARFEDWLRQADSPPSSKSLDRSH